MTVSKLKKTCITIQEAHSKCEQNWPMILHTTITYVYYYIQPGSYPPDRGSVRCTKSIRDIIEHKGLSNTLVT